jgi:hypothetical protein
MSWIGRNSPCPCGSGIKHQKCCLEKERLASHQDLLSLHELAEAAICPWETSYEPSPYVLAKTLAGHDKVKAQWLAHKYGRMTSRLWTPDRLFHLRTREIEQHLRDAGLEMNRELFIEQAEGETSAWQLSRTWCRRVLGREREPDTDDFLGLAACELWSRYLPQRPSREMLGDWIEEGIRHIATGEKETASDIWWRVWDSLTRRITSSMTRPKQAESLVATELYLDDWLLAFADLLETMAFDSEGHAERGIAFCDQYLTLFHDEDISVRAMVAQKKATMLSSLGRHDEELQVLEEICSNATDRG